MPRVIRTERGWGGHFICADRCLFRRNTLLECGEARIVVSTVGNMRQVIAGGNLGEPDTIGHNRYFETMAFQARKEGVYWEANVSSQVDFGSEWAIDHCVLGTDLEANDMHEAVVKELTCRLRAGNVPPGPGAK